MVPVELIPGEFTTGWDHVRALLVAVEILSPSTEHVDRRAKRDFYLARGVGEYWIVDLDGRVIERWVPHRPTPALVRDRFTRECPRHHRTAHGRCAGLLPEGVSVASPALSKRQVSERDMAHLRAAFTAPHSSVVPFFAPRLDSPHVVSGALLLL